MELDKLLLDLDVRKDGIVAKPSFEDVEFEGEMIDSDQITDVS